MFGDWRLQHGKSWQLVPAVLCCAVYCTFSVNLMHFLWCRMGFAEWSGPQSPLGDKMGKVLGNPNAGSPKGLSVSTVCWVSCPLHQQLHASTAPVIWSAAGQCHKAVCWPVPFCSCYCYRTNCVAAAGQTVWANKLASLALLPATNLERYQLYMLTQFHSQAPKHNPTPNYNKLLPSTPNLTKTQPSQVPEFPQLKLYTSFTQHPLFNLYTRALTVAAASLVLHHTLKHLEIGGEGLASAARVVDCHRHVTTGRQAECHGHSVVIICVD